MAARDDVVMEPRVSRLHARAVIEIHLVFFAARHRRPQRYSVRHARYQNVTRRLL